MKHIPSLSCLATSLVWPATVTPAVSAQSANYPVRLDLTFSEADWITMGGLPVLIELRSIKRNFCQKHLATLEILIAMNRRT